MRPRLRILLLLLLCAPVFVRPANSQEMIADLLEQYSLEQESGIDYSTFSEELLLISQNPINLNRATREQLEKLPFLRDEQVEKLLSYRSQFGDFNTLYELQLIEGLDRTDIRHILPFVYVGAGENQGPKLYWVDVLKYGKNEILFRLDHGFENKAGYNELPDAVDTARLNPSNYMGSQLYNSLKYRFHYKDRINLAFTAEKDAGEPLWIKEHKGYDFYSASVQLNGFGKCKTLVVGDFKAGFGQGLVLQSGFRMGKSAFVLNVSPRATGLKKYSATDASEFFRGGGATLQFGKIDFTSFYSNKSIDGDTLQGSFSSWDRSGLHRTVSEYQSKQTINQQVFGLNATFNLSLLQLGVTCVHTLLDHRLQFEKAVYNQFYFAGNAQTTAGVHYRLRLLKLNLFGETASSEKGALATLNGFSFTPAPPVSLLMLHRYYAPKYDRFYAASFSESSQLNNESGLYLAAEVTPYKKFKVRAAVDSYRFPWPKYGVDFPSMGQYYFSQIDYQPRRDLTMFFRFRYDQRVTNDLPTGSVLSVPVPLEKSSFCYALHYAFGDFSFQNKFDANFVPVWKGDLTAGYLFTQDVSYAPQQSAFKINLRLQLFDAPNYQNRFYAYEQDLLYAFSIPLIYGVGTRYYFNLRYDINKALSLWFKIAQTIYSDERESIGSGNEIVIGNKKTDCRLLLKYHF